MVDYMVDIVTGNMPYAHTCEQVHIVLTGTRGQSQEMALRKAYRDGFEQGQTDRFSLQDIPDLGRLTHVQITLTPFDHTTSYVKAWFLDQVRIMQAEQDDTTFTWTCRCSKWLGTESGQQLGYTIPVSTYKVERPPRRLRSRPLNIDMKRKRSKQTGYNDNILPIAAQKKWL